MVGSTSPEDWTGIRRGATDRRGWAQHRVRCQRRGGGRPGRSTDTTSKLVVQPDGTLLAVGSRLSGYKQTLATARFLPTGALDTAFGHGGTITYRSRASTEAPTAAPTADGGAFVAGRDETDMTVGRLGGDGQPDTSFSGDGFRTIDFGGIGMVRTRSRSSLTAAWSPRAPATTLAS